MTTITATPATATGSVALELALTASVVKVIRSNVNGSAEVRPAAGQLPSPAAGTLILADYEAAHGVNSYNAYAADGSFVTASATLTLDKPWLSVPVMPQYSEQVDLVTAYGSTREAASTVHRPIGRPDSLVVLGKLGDRKGSLEVYCQTYADARAIERVFERGEIVHLRQRVAGLDMYFTVTGVPVAPFQAAGEEDTRWAVRADYVEVRRPLGELAGALGWTFDELTAAYPSFDAVAAAFTDFDALTLGESIA
ncbi:minor tail protein [Arthrobacter phage BlueFeather]|uniref:Minor tail protein n=1 Tax=Arthrobacter phage BlueFeather TaxID=2713258 RepID=A0A6G8R274_9CAUD|nr:minor tail protein [Arthrobacter phage BlueFeather]QIN94315.1 minor tail protein [Arthrobacter phage BlueFeather]